MPPIPWTNELKLSNAACAPSVILTPAMGATSSTRTMSSPQMLPKFPPLYELQMSMTRSGFTARSFSALMSVSVSLTWAIPLKSNAFNVDSSSLEKPMMPTGTTPYSSNTGAVSAVATMRSGILSSEIC